MTSLAYLHDCHSCNDERSIVQKKTLVFPGEPEIFRAVYAQIGEEEQVISPPYTRTPLDASMRGRKKRKQGEDNAPVG